MAPAANTKPPPSVPASELPSMLPSMPRSSRATGHSRPGATSAPPASAANARGRSSTTISPCRKTRAASSSPRRCASSRPVTGVRTWWRHGCAPPASICARNARTGGSSAFRCWTAVSAATSTAASWPARRPWRIRVCGRTRRSGRGRGRTSSSGASSSPSRSTPRRWPSTRPISTCPTRRCSPRSIATPGSSTASWCRSMRRWRSG